MPPPVTRPNPSPPPTRIDRATSPAMRDPGRPLPGAALPLPTPSTRHIPTGGTAACRTVRVRVRAGASSPATGSCRPVPTGRTSGRGTGHGGEGWFPDSRRIGSGGLAGPPRCVRRSGLPCRRSRGSGRRRAMLDPERGAGFVERVGSGRRAPARAEEAIRERRAVVGEDRSDAHGARAQVLSGVRGRRPARPAPMRRCDEALLLARAVMGSIAVNPVRGSTWNGAPRAPRGRLVHQAAISGGRSVRSVPHASCGIAGSGWRCPSARRPSAAPRHRIDRPGR